MVTEAQYRQACSDQYSKDKETEAYFVQACYHLEKENLHPARDSITKILEKVSDSQQITLVNLLSKEIIRLNSAHSLSYWQRPHDTDFINFITLVQRLHKKGVANADTETWLLPGQSNYEALLKWIASEPKALYKLGQMHYSGDFGVPQNNAEALKCFLQAYQGSRDPSTANDIGCAYNRQNDTKNALLYFEKASDGRNRYGSYNVALQYHFGKTGIPKDLDKAERYYKRAIEQTADREVYPNAHYQLARVYKERDSIKEESRSCYYWESFLDLSKKHHKIAADAGHTLAAFELAVLYQAEKNNAEAEIYFKKAAEKENTESQWRLSELYRLSGKHSDAENYLKKAASAGNANANYQLGCQHEGKKAYQEAFVCFHKALENNHADAREKLVDQKNRVASYYSLYNLLKKEGDTFETTLNAMDPYLRLQEALGYFFKDAHYLINALTRTINSESKEAPFQRLEFLGDSILGTIVKEYFVDKSPSAWTLGDINRAIEPLVSNQGALLTLAERLKLSELLILDKSEERAPATKKMQSDAMEALLGAIFQDSKSSKLLDKAEGYSSVRSVVHTLWQPDFEKALQTPVVTEKKASTLSISRVAAPLPPPAPLKTTVTLVSPVAPVVSQQARQLAAQYNPALFGSLKTPLSEYKVALETEGGANGNRQGKQGDTPLMFLIRCEQGKTGKNAFKPNVIDRIRLLLKAGAMWDTRNKKGESAKGLFSQFPESVRNKVPASLGPLI
eukprot:TRINITY_DN13739_c0_g1_i1.p1 TRINITY_DN13739_c0_g1~~TRINITY_DN13739_c0_g1_i1.p1  ORF type:complete len:737 (+),score=-104.23 TRINITY_DN13739_c0_g1_i1:41-2251(+)